MMSVISAQSTARNVPADAPKSAAPTSAIGIDGAIAAIASPSDPDDAARVDHGLATDSVGHAGAWHDREQIRDDDDDEDDDVRPVRLLDRLPVRLLQVGDHEVHEHRAAHQEEAAATRRARRTTVRGGCRCPRPSSRSRPRTGRRGPSAAGPGLTRTTTATIVTSSTIATAAIASSIRSRPTATRHEEEAGHVAEDLHHPDQGAGHADLALGDEVRDVALERAAGDVRADRQERRRTTPRIRTLLAVAMPARNTRSSSEPNDDVRLAPAPAADRVVADRADRRLDRGSTGSRPGSPAGTGSGRPRAGRRSRRSSAGSG